MWELLCRNKIRSHEKHCRDKRGHVFRPKRVDYGIMTIFVVATNIYCTVDTEVLTFFVFLLVTEALLRCRVVAVMKLKSCRVPSSD